MRVLSFFSGAGGMDLGFELAGHEVVWANDFDENAIETYRKNIGKYSNSAIILDDIKNLLNCSNFENSNLIPEAEILIGGFPCQGFSVANIKRSMEDERNYLYLELLKVINLKNPKFILLENVKGLENMEKGKVLEMILKDIEKSGEGYKVVYNVFNALNFGVPQNRERVIILGVRKDILKKFELPLINKEYKGYKNLYIPFTHSKESNIKDMILPHEKVNNLYKKWKMKELKKSEDIDNKEPVYSFSTIFDAIGDLPLEFLEKEGLYNHVGTKCKVNIKNTVGNRETYWDKYSPTIMGRGSGTGGPLIIPHPSKTRRLTVRETARIQTFPDDFIFYGSNSACYRQIGNAVPVLMAYNIAKIFPKEIDY